MVVRILLYFLKFLTFGLFVLRRFRVFFGLVLVDCFSSEFEFAGRHGFLLGEKLFGSGGCWVSEMALMMIGCPGFIRRERFAQIVQKVGTQKRRWHLIILLHFLL